MFTFWSSATIFASYGSIAKDTGGRASWTPGGYRWGHWGPGLMGPQRLSPRTWGPGFMSPRGGSQGTGYFNWVKRLNAILRAATQKSCAFPPAWSVDPHAS